MIIGNGMVAQSFSQFLTREDVVIFASGVSNSKSEIESEFKKEEELLCNSIQSIQKNRLVYFSTFNLYDPNEFHSAYCLHKLNMENIISERVDNYNIFRLGHVAGKNAKQYTILNYLFNAIKSETEFDIWENAARNIIDIEDISKICSYIIENNLFINQITNICNSQNTSILEIVRILEEILGKKGKFNILEKGGSPKVDNSKIQNIAIDLGINFNESYAQTVITKYYRLS